MAGSPSPTTPLREVVMDTRGHSGHELGSSWEVLP